VPDLVNVFLMWKRVGSAALGSTQNRTGSCMVSDKTSHRGFHVISHQRPLHTQSYQQRSWDRFLARERHFFPKEHRLALGLSQFIYWVHRGYAPAVKRPGRRA